jgi:branched-chain amino acid transport system ATP-binding protein
VSALLELEDVEARYGPVQALHGITLEVAEGEVVAVLGANGAGKTTTLRAISGTVRRSGRIVFGGKPLRGGPEAVAHAGIAHVPEGRGIFYGLTVAEHFKLGYGNERPDEALAHEYFPKLEELRTRRAGLLSGGEQQMLAIARALARRPRLLLLDELSLGLAPVIVESLLPVVHQYALDSGCGVLLVEQHIHLALEIADRGYVLSHGEIVLHERAQVLNADRELLISSYLGEQQVPIGGPNPEELKEA